MRDQRVRPSAGLTWMRMFLRQSKYTFWVEAVFASSRRQRNPIAVVEECNSAAVVGTFTATAGPL